MKRSHLASALAFGISICACSSERTVDGVAPAHGPVLHAKDSEEEVFGYLLNIEGGTYVDLVPLTHADTANQLGLNTNYRMWGYGAHNNGGANWGWFGVNLGVECGTSGGRIGEVHWDDVDVPPATDSTPVEAHCINTGHFNVIVANAHGTPMIVAGRTMTRPIDFVNYPYYLSPLDSVVPRIEDPVLVVSPSQAPDVRFTFNGLTTGQSNTPFIEADAVPVVGQNPWSGVHVSATQGIQGPSNFWFRFGAWKTTSTDGDVLVRYFWNLNGNLNDRTGFGNAKSVDGLARVKQFSQGAYTVVAQLANNTQFGADADASWGSPVQFTVNAYAPLTAVISPTPVYVEVSKSLSLSDAGSNGSGGNSYTWRFGDGTGTTGSSVSHTYVALGTYHDTLTKTDSHGYSIFGTGTVTVVSAPGVSIHAFYANQSGSVAPNQTCSYRADVTGGDGAGSLRWYINGVAAGTARVQDVTVAGSNFTVSVTSYDLADSAKASKSVTVSGGGQICS